MPAIARLSAVRVSLARLARPAVPARPLSLALAVAVALAGSSLALVAAPPAAHAYSYAAAGKEPMIDGREASLAAVANKDWDGAATIIAGLKDEITYLEEHHVKGLAARFSDAIAARDEKALRGALVAACSAEIERRLDGAKQNLKDFQTSKVLVIKARRFLDAIGGDLPGDARSAADAALTNALAAVGNPGVFGVGAKPVDPEAFAKAEADVHKALAVK